MVTFAYSGVNIVCPPSAFFLEKDKGRSLDAAFLLLSFCIDWITRTAMRQRPSLGGTKSAVLGHEKTKCETYICILTHIEWTTFKKTYPQIGFFLPAISKTTISDICLSSLVFLTSHSNYNILSFDSEIISTKPIQNIDIRETFKTSKKNFKKKKNPPKYNF